MFDTLSIGGATLDIFLKSKKFDVAEIKGAEVLTLSYGGKLDVDDFAMQSGGGATNTAVGWARLGFKSAVVAEVGKDLAAQAILQELEKEKVDTRFIVKEKGENTAVSALLIAADGGRAAVTARGAASLLTVEDIPWPKIQANWLHLSSVGNVPLIQKVGQHCKKNRLRFSWNPGGSDLAALESGKLHLHEVSPTIFYVNEEEAQRVTDAGYQLENAGQAVIVTNGREGGRWYQHGKWYRYAPTHSEVIQETGAGDAFLTGVVAGLLHDRRFIEAIEWGKAEAASVIQHMGAKTGLLTSIPGEKVV